ncbi:MAG: BON domain-containing protein [Actinomycetota bacterium]
MTSKLATTLAASLALSALVAGCATEGTKPPQAAEPAVAVSRSRNEMNRDDGVARVVMRTLAEADRNSFRAVTAEVWNGRTLLVGAVSKPEQRRRASGLAKGVEGVTEVIDELILAEDKTFAAFSPVAQVENDLRGRILSDDAIKGFYSVRVVNGVAYMLGVAPTADEILRVKAIAMEHPQVKWVVSHVQVAK